MREVNTKKPDREAMVSDKAEDFAEKQYAREFNDLPPDIQMTVWMAAEHEVEQQLVMAAEARMDAEDERLELRSRRKLQALARILR